MNRFDKPTLVIHCESPVPVTKGRALVRTLKKQIKEQEDTKDRVDISLKEYEGLKMEVRKLYDDNRQLVSFIKELGITPDLVDNIVPGSIRKWSYISPMDPFDSKRKIRIEFDVNKG